MILTMPIHLVSPGYGVKIPRHWESWVGRLLALLHLIRQHRRNMRGESSVLLTRPSPMGRLQSGYLSAWRTIGQAACTVLNLVVGVALYTI